VLVAEDQALIALDLEGALLAFGCVVLPSTPSAAGALAALRAERPDAVLLDVNLSDGSAAPVARALVAAGVPFAVLTGHEPCQLADPTLREAPYLGKPYQPDELRATMAGLAAAVAAPR
jgi:CheY-like chemotaxis protein